MTLLLLYVVAALTISFLCSYVEAVLLSITPAYVGVLEERRHPAARRVRRLREDVERPLAAILTLNTVANTVGATLAGAQAARVFGDAAVGVFSGVLTFLVLVVSEIIPKSIAAATWKRMAPRMMPVLHAVTLAVWPVARIAEWLTKLTTPREKEPAVSRDEIRALATEGRREGVVGEGETRVLSNLLRLSRLCVRDVMTPSDHVLALPRHATVSDILAQHQEFEYSPMPLDCGTRYVLKDDILGSAARDAHGRRLEEIARELLKVPETEKLPRVFDDMAGRREHIALAVDDTGRTVGVVTMEDLIETLLGMEIFDESDSGERLHELARSCWKDRKRRQARVRLGITGGRAA